MNNRTLEEPRCTSRWGCRSLPRCQCNVAHAASGDGSLVGRLTDGDNKPLPDAEVTVRNPQTGFTRTVKADADGYYRFPFLPVGKYIVEATQERRDARQARRSHRVARHRDHRERRRSAVTTLEEIQVLGTRIVTAVDVKSTESATNVTREELERLPVERDLLSVALLAPGLDQGRRGCARRQLRRLLRRLLDRREHRLHQRPQRHRLLQPRRLLRRCRTRSTRNSRSRPAATRSSSAARPAA